MLVYFEEYYIGKFKRNSKSIREIPLFPPRFWNLHERVINDVARTNNAMEVWHKNFQSSCCSQPSLDKLLHQFRLEQNLTDVLLDQLESGDVYKKRNKASVLNDHLKFLCESYDSKNILDFLDKISTNFI